MKYELQSVISGTLEVKHGTIIQAITRNLKTSQSSGSLAKEYQHFKKQENIVKQVDNFVVKN
ncbi:MAG: hypothetical protein U0V72_13965 [Cytophagales bacterium]